MYNAFIAGITGGAIAGLILKFFSNKFQVQADTQLKEVPIESLEIIEGPIYKLALVINTDLKMSAGKIMVQCSHATLGILEKYYSENKVKLKVWEKKGNPITIYKVSDTETLVSLQRNAKKMRLMTYLVQDAGRTQIASGSRTVLAIGPDISEKVESIVGNLPLYS